MSNRLSRVTRALVAQGVMACSSIKNNGVAGADL